MQRSSLCRRCSASVVANTLLFAVQVSGGSASAHWAAEYPRSSELAFDRGRKLMSVACRHGGQSLVFSKGAPEALLPRCSLAIDEAGQAGIEMTPQLREEWLTVAEGWGEDAALRCVALAYAAVPGNRGELVPADEENLVFLGVVGLQDPPRPEVPRAVQQCSAAGIRVLMLTGACSC